MYLLDEIINVIIYESIKSKRQINSIKSNQLKNSILKVISERTQLLENINKNQYFEISRIFQIFIKYCRGNFF